MPDLARTLKRQVAELTREVAFLRRQERKRVAEQPPAEAAGAGFDQVLIKPVAPQRVTEAAEAKVKLPR